MNNLNVLKLGFFCIIIDISIIYYLCDYFLHKIGDLSSKIKCRYVYKLESSYYPCTVPIFRMKSLKKQKMSSNVMTLHKSKKQCCWNSMHKLQMIAYMYFLL